MTKGNRKRANKENPKKISTKSKKQPACDIPNIVKDYPVRALNNSDVNRFKELVTLSNNVAGLMKQCVDTDLSIAKGNEVAQQMMDGVIKGPALQKITPSLYLPITDIKGVAKKIKDEIELLKQANTISKSQLAQRYDDYVDSLRNVKREFEQLLTAAPKQEIKKIRGARIEKSEKDAQVIFEKEVDKLTEEDTKFLKTIKKQIDANAVAKDLKNKPTPKKQ